MPSHASYHTMHEDQQRDWLSFMAWLMPLEAQQASNEGLVLDQVLALYGAAVTPDAVWERFTQVAEAYRVLDKATYYLVDELAELKYNGLDIPLYYQEIDDPRMQADERKLLNDYMYETRWYDTGAQQGAMVQRQVDKSAALDLINIFCELQEFITDLDVRQNYWEDLERMVAFFWRLELAARAKNPELIIDQAARG